MVARKRGPKIPAMVFALTMVGAFSSSLALAQSQSDPTKARPFRVLPGAKKDQAHHSPFRQADIPKLEMERIAVNPTDPIATVNGEVITRMQLADECVARKGEEILYTLNARKLIDQALKKAKVEITAADFLFG